MATKKLSVEVDVDTAEAKKKLQEMESSGGQSVAPKVENAADNAARAIDRLSASAQRCAAATEAETAKKKLEKIEDTGGQSAAPQVESAAERMARSMEKASSSTDRHAEAAEKSSANMLAATKFFTGIGVSLASNYAASHMKQGAARDAVEYGANAVAGASAGAAVGKLGGGIGTIIGAVVGGAGGIGKTWLDKSAEKDRYTESWKKSEHDYRDAKDFADFFRGLTDAADKSKSFAEKIDEAKQQLEHYRSVEKTLVGNVDKMISNGRYDDATAQRGYLNENRQRQQQLEALVKSLEVEKAKTERGSAADYSAVDALARIGGSFAGGGGADTMRNLEQNSKDQLTVLREIRDKKTGGTF